MRGFLGKFRKDGNALSPIFAVLILIAVAVIAGIIVYMYTTGYLATMMGGGTVAQEKVAIEAVVVSGDTTTVYAKSTGGGAVTVTEAILKNSQGQTIEVNDIADVVLPSAGGLMDVPCTWTTGNVVAGNTYTVTLVTKEGNAFVSPAFKA